MNGRILSFIFWVGMYIEGYALEEGAGQQSDCQKIFPVSGLRSPKSSEFC